MIVKYMINKSLNQNDGSILFNGCVQWNLEFYRPLTGIGSGCSGRDGGGVAERVRGPWYLGQSI